MQIFANGKQRFHYFTEFYVIHLKMKGEKFDHSTTLSLTLSTDCGGRSQLGLTNQFRWSKNRGKDFFLSEILSLNSMHAYIAR